MNHPMRQLTFPIGLAARRSGDSFFFVNLRRILFALGFALLSAASLQAATVDAKVFSVSGTVEFAGPGKHQVRPPLGNSDAFGHAWPLPGTSISGNFHDLNVWTQKIYEQERE